MPWEHKTVEEKRTEFAKRAETTKNFSALCDEYGITRRIGYKWVARAQNGESMSDRSRAPKTVSNKTNEDMEQSIVALRAENPGWGGKKLRKVMENEGYTGLPCAKTYGNILKRNGCILPEESRKHKAYQRFERETCNELWQTDFKGDFLLGDNSRCYPLTIIDDHSRFLIGSIPKPNQRDIIDDFRMAFVAYGKPGSILSDNGGTFRGRNGGFVGFERWLMEHDIQPIHGRVRHPQTQGKVERLHGTLDTELLNHRHFFDLQEAAEAFAEWRQKYNNVRPHEALDMRCPAQAYVPGDRVYRDEVPPYEYSGEHKVIKVNSWGYARFAGFQAYLSEAFINQFVEFRANPLGGSWIACFRNFRIAEFDIVTGELINKKIRRLGDFV